MKTNGEDYLSCVLGRLPTRSVFYFMDYLIADTFTDSLARLTGDEQKSGQTTVVDLEVSDSRHHASP